MGRGSAPLSPAGPDSPTRLAEARVIRDLRAGAAGAFLTVWNGLAPDVWSVLVGVFDDDATALGWATTFRLDLATRVSSFSLDQPLSVQVGRALVTHLAAGLDPAPRPLPSAPGSTPDETLISLPPLARLRYLADLFFHVELDGSGADDIALLRLMEPGQHTDARRTAQSLLQRLPPQDVLLYPPGAAPTPRQHLYQRPLVAAGVLAFGLLVLLGIGLRPHTVDWTTSVARHARFTETPGPDSALTLGANPDDVSLTLIRAGARVTLVEIPDLGPEGLRLLGGADVDAGGDDEAVVAVYVRDAGADVTFWTLTHTRADLPEDASSGGAIATHDVAGHNVAGWSEAGGSWILTGAPDAAVLATQIRDRRAAKGP